MADSDSTSAKLSPSNAVPDIGQTTYEVHDHLASAQVISSLGVHPMHPRPRRYVLRTELTPELDSIVREMAEGEGKGGLAKMMRDALGLLKIAQDAHKEGKRLVLVDDRENSEQEITL